MRKTSNVALGIDTRERLKSLGHKGQTYDEIICELLTQSGRNGNVKESNPGTRFPNPNTRVSSMKVIEAEP